MQEMARQKSRVHPLRPNTLLYIVQSTKVATWCDSPLAGSSHTDVTVNVAVSSLLPRFCPLYDIGTLY